MVLQEHISYRINEDRRVYQRQAIYLEELDAGELLICTPKKVIS